MYHFHHPILVLYLNEISKEYIYLTIFASVWHFYHFPTDVLNFFGYSDLSMRVLVYPRDYEILGWCPAGSVLPYGEKVPL